MKPATKPAPKLPALRDFKKDQRIRTKAGKTAYVLEDSHGMGVEVMDVIPETYPESAYKAADKLIAGLEELNGLTLETIFETCRDAEGDHRREPDEDEFGYCMAMQAMGHGVGWDDNHPSMFHAERIDWGTPPINRPQVFRVPNVEYTYFDLPEGEYPILIEGEN